LGRIAQYDRDSGAATASRRGDVEFYRGPCATYRLSGRLVGSRKRTAFKPLDDRNDSLTRPRFDREREDVVGAGFDPNFRSEKCPRESASIRGDLQRNRTRLRIITRSLDRFCTGVTVPTGSVCLEPAVRDQVGAVGAVAGG